MKEIFLVMGQVGEYSDRREWPVVAYLERALADAHGERAADWAREWWAEKNRRQDDGTWDYLPPASPHDSKVAEFDYSFRPPDYYVLVVQLDDNPAPVGEPPNVAELRAQGHKATCGVFSWDSITRAWGGCGCGVWKGPAISGGRRS